MPEFTPEQLSRIEALALNARASGEHWIGKCNYEIAKWMEQDPEEAKHYAILAQEACADNRVLSEILATIEEVRRA